jgi:ribonuclease J
VVATLGRSMAKNVALGRELGLLSIPDACLVDIERIDKFPPEKVCVISTGSQGEPMSALALMAAGDNRWVKLSRGDTVILSSHAIPGNEHTVGQVIDGIHRLGADVVHSGLAPVHVSGHAKQEEIKTLFSVARPEFFIPIHGEFRHLTHHTRLAMAMGIPDERILLCEDGDVVELGDDGIEFVGEVPAGYLYVDGIVGDVGRGVLRDRRVLAEEGVVVVVVTVDARTGEIVAGPELITRGWVYAPEAESLLEEARKVITVSIEDAVAQGATDYESIRRHVRQAAGRFVNERTRRRPMIVPVVMEV